MSEPAGRSGERGDSTAPDGAAGSRERPPTLDSRALLQGHRVVEIHHNGERYRLQATRQGKLILTK